MPIRTGKITPFSTPYKGERVECPTRGVGVVLRAPKPGNVIWVKFKDAGEVMFTHRAALQAWKAFPGPADAEGLRLSGMMG